MINYMLAIQQLLDNDLKQVILTYDIDPYSIPFLYKDKFIRKKNFTSLLSISYERFTSNIHYCSFILFSSEKFNSQRWFTSHYKHFSFIWVYNTRFTIKSNDKLICFQIIKWEKHKIYCILQWNHNPIGLIDHRVN